MHISSTLTGAILVLVAAGPLHPLAPPNNVIAHIHRRPDSPQLHSDPSESSTRSTVVLKRRSPRGGRGYRDNGGDRYPGSDSRQGRDASGRGQNGWHQGHESSYGSRHGDDNERYDQPDQPSPPSYNDNVPVQVQQPSQQPPQQPSQRPPQQPPQQPSQKPSGNPSMQPEQQTSPASPKSPGMPSNNDAGKAPASKNTNSKGLITLDQFKAAFEAAGYPPPEPPELCDKKFTHFITDAVTDAGITSVEELAMFLTHVLWESDGLRAREEYACLKTKCPNQYRSAEALKGISYYGRGYIQLTWAYNYLAASRALFGDDSLLKNPEKVARNPSSDDDMDDDDISWRTASWFWKTNVHCKLNGTLEFGRTTRAINSMECDEPDKKSIAQKRFKKYTSVLKAFGSTATPNESGCYKTASHS